MKYSFTSISLWSIVIIVVGLLAIFTLTKIVPEEKYLGTQFSHNGNMVNYNPGLKPGIWHLVYEEPGSPGLSTQLIFNKESVCKKGGIPHSCDQPFEQGARVHVEGIKKGSTVYVQTLTYDGVTARKDVTIKLYYYNPALDQGPGGVQCTQAGLTPVSRIIPRTNTPIQDAIKLLLRGEITAEERAQGIMSEFPLEGVALTSVSLVGGELTLLFTDTQHKTVGGSCRASILWKQIEATAKQFPEVASVRFLPEELFQP